jgi:hypothetical protein
MNAIRQEVVVREEGILEVRSPELRIGDEAEVIVLIKPAPNLETADDDKLDWRDFMGCFMGDHGSADNESIDRDLAASYMDTHEPRE